MDKTLVTQVVAAAARHLLSGLAGTLVTLGAIGHDQENNFVTIGVGIVVWGVGFAWSYWQKRRAAKAKHG